MKREIAVLDAKEGKIRVTTVDERWYMKGIEIPEDKRKIEVPELFDIAIAYPSVNYVIDEGWPMGQGLFYWYVREGMREAKRIGREARRGGSMAHQGCERISKGEDIDVATKFFDPSSIEWKEAESDYWWAISTYRRWLDDNDIEILAVEKTVYSETPRYAGTVDLVCRIEDQVWIIDLKTSDRIYDSNKLQLSAYSHADYDLKELGVTKEEWENRKMGILRIGYSRHKGKEDKPGYLFREIDDHFGLFRHAYAIWKYREGNKKPKQVELPTKIKGIEKNENNLS